MQPSFSVLIGLKRSGARLKRDVILLSESDEEAGSTGIRWMIQNAYSKIDAEFALNEGGAAFDSGSRTRIFQIQTAEKIPTRVVLTAKGTAGHASLPRPDNPVVHLARAITRLADSDQPVKLNTTTLRYFSEIAKLPDYEWLRPLLPKLSDPAAAVSAANRIREHDPELNAMLRTSVSPTMLQAGIKVNVIPNTAVAQIDVRRLPNETREEIEVRFRQTINDPAVEITREPGQEMPATEPSFSHHRALPSDGTGFLPDGAQGRRSCRTCLAAQPTDRFCGPRGWRCMASRFSCGRVARAGLTAMMSALHRGTWLRARTCYGRLSWRWLWTRLPSSSSSRGVCG